MPSRAGNAKRLSQGMESSLSLSSALLHGYCARLPEQSPHNGNYANLKIEDLHGDYAVYMFPETELQGRIAVISGASRGIGKTIALELASAGATVVLVGRDEAKLTETASEAHRLGSEASVFVTDVAQEDDILALEDNIRSRFGRVDILINNAGINMRKPLLEFTLDEWRSVLDTNLTSVFLTCRSIVPLMRGREYGRIINMASTMSHVSLAGRSAYSASKAGILGLTRALALELADHGITVVAISPGPFATELNTTLMNNAELNRQILSKVPLAKWGEVRDIAKLTRFLCSPHAGYITGTDILIDGGWTAQ
jgi:NAD(P)-dependent dehydrogenase (short-subunit alcohol dehydrogenase family)